MDNYDALIAALPESVKPFVVLVLQLIAVLALTVPLLEKLAKLTKSTKDDQALSTFQRVLSIFPRVQIPALTNPPPPPAQVVPVKLEVTAWPKELPAIPPPAPAAPSEPPEGK